MLDAATLGDDVSLSVFRALGELEIYGSTAQHEIELRIRDAEILILNKVRLGADNLRNASRLKLICITATGYDNIDLAYCREKGIGVTNVAGYSTDSVAQVTVATVLSLACHLREYDRVCREGVYSRSTAQNCLKPPYFELSGKTWGIVGLGNIGRRVASVASALGCRVIAVRRSTTEPSPFETVSLDRLCRESDIISLHIPLSEETRGLISRERISLMKQGAILMNAARGAVVDEVAVADAVLSGRIAFGTDVYSQEPYPTDHPFSRLSACDHVLLTPHMAWGAYEARCRCLNEVAENIRAFLSGKRRSRID